MKSVFGLSIAAIVLVALPALAQTINRVGVHKDWAHFSVSGSGGGASECWAATEPKASSYQRGGQEIASQAVRRDPHQLQAVFSSGSSAAQIAFAAGYKYAAGATVSMIVDGRSFTFMTENLAGANGAESGWAWPRDPADESRIVAAMKRGSEAVITGRSSRGTQTRDTFSLLGFTAAVDNAQRQCAG
jgi:hypothetical protein